MSKYKFNANYCYICIGKINNPVYPAGCNHGFCKEHLKVNIYYIIIAIIQEIIKLECGICRLPFKKEYFGDDPIVNILYPDNRGSRPNRVRINMMDNNDNINQNNNRNNNLRGNQNQNEIIRVIQSENDRINRNNNNYRRQNYNNRENYDYRNDEYDLFFECKAQTPCLCLIIFVFGGLSTFVIGIIEKNSFLWLLGIFNFLVFVLFFVIMFLYFFDFSELSINPILFFYTFVFLVIGLVLSLYTGIFHNIFVILINHNLFKKRKKLFL